MRRMVSTGRGAIGALVLLAIAACGQGAGGRSSGERPRDDGSAGWPKRMGERVLSVATGAGGRVFVASESMMYADPLVVGAYDAAGVLLWEHRWGGAHVRPVHARGLAPAPDGGVYVAFGPGCDPGASAVCHPLDVGGTPVGGGALVRIAGDGAIAWVRPVDVDPYGDREVALAGAPDGRVAAYRGEALTVFGPGGDVELTTRESGSFEPAFDRDGALYVVRSGRLVKLDRAGASTWEVSTAPGWHAAIATSADGRLVAVLSDRISPPVAVEIHSTADGTLLSTAASPVCCSLALEASGAAVVAGNDTSSALAVASFAPSSGAIVADRLLAAIDGASPTVNAVAVREDGTVFVAGESWGSADTSFGSLAIPVGGGFVLALGPGLEAAFGATGPHPAPAPARWVKAGESGPLAVAPDASGGAFVTSVAGSSGDTLVLRSMSGDGAIPWERRFAGLWERSAGGLAATPDGGVLVAIRWVCGIQKAACDRSPPDLGGGPIARDALVKLGPDGAFAWQVQTTGLDDTSLAVGPRGEVAVVVSGQLTVREADGALRWVSGDPAANEAVCGTPAFDDQGNVYAARSGGTDPPTAYRLWSWSADGRLRWIGPVAESYQGGPYGSWSSLRVSILAGGAVLGAWPLGPVLALLAVDAATGMERWSARLGGWPPERPVLAAPDGGVLVVGALPDGCHDIVVVHLDAAGRAGPTPSLTSHASCVGAPSLWAAALLADGAILFGGATYVAADVGGTSVPAGTGFLAVTPAP